MNNKTCKTCNTSIKCSVDTCAYHSGAQNCCSLDSIKVGCCDCSPTKCEGTECASFKRRGGGCKNPLQIGDLCGTIGVRQT